MTKKLNLRIADNGELMTQENVYLGRIYALCYYYNHKEGDKFESALLTGWEIQNAIDTLPPYSHELERELMQKVMIWGRLACKISIQEYSFAAEDVDLVKKALMGFSDAQAQLRQAFASYMVLFQDQLITEGEVNFFDEDEEDTAIMDVTDSSPLLDAFPQEKAFEIALDSIAEYSRNNTTI